MIIYWRAKKTNLNWEATRDRTTGKKKKKSRPKLLLLSSRSGSKSIIIIVMSIGRSVGRLVLSGYYSSPYYGSASRTMLDIYTRETMMKNLLIPSISLPPSSHYVFWSSARRISGKASEIAKIAARPHFKFTREPSRTERERTRVSILFAEYTPDLIRQRYKFVVGASPPKQQQEMENGERERGGKIMPEMTSESWT